MCFGEVEGDAEWAAFMFELLDEPEDILVAEERVGVVDVGGGDRGSFGGEFVASDELFGEREDEGAEDDGGEDGAERAALGDAFWL